MYNSRTLRFKAHHRLPLCCGGCAHPGCGDRLCEHGAHSLHGASPSPHFKCWVSAVAMLTARCKTCLHHAVVVYFLFRKKWAVVLSKERVEKAAASWNDGTGDRCDSEEWKMPSLGSALELVLWAVWSWTGTPGPPHLLTSCLGNGIQQKSVEGPQQRGKGFFSPPLPYHFGSRSWYLLAGEPTQAQGRRGATVCGVCPVGASAVSSGRR